MADFDEDDVIIFENTPLGAFLKECAPQFTDDLEPCLEDELKDNCGSEEEVCRTPLPIREKCPLQKNGYFLMPVAWVFIASDFANVVIKDHVQTVVEKPNALARVWYRWTFSQPSALKCEAFVRSANNFLSVANECVSFIRDCTYASTIGTSFNDDALQCMNLRQFLLDSLLEVRASIARSDFQEVSCPVCCPPPEKMTYPVFSGVDLSLASLKEVYLRTKECFVEFCSFFANALINGCGRLQIANFEHFISSVVDPLFEDFSVQEKRLNNVLTWNRNVVDARSEESVMPVIHLPPEMPLIIFKFRLFAILRRIEEFMKVSGDLLLELVLMDMEREVRSARTALDFYLDDSSKDEPSPVAPQPIIEEADKLEVKLIDAPYDPVDEVFDCDGTGANPDDRVNSMIAHFEPAIRRDLVLLAELRPKLEKLRDNWDKRDKKSHIEDLPDIAEIGILKCGANERRAMDEQYDENSQRCQNPVHFEAIALRMASFAPMLESVVSRMKEEVLCGDSSDEEH